MRNWGSGVKSKGCVFCVFRLADMVTERWGDCMGACIVKGTGKHRYVGHISHHLLSNFPNVYTCVSLIMKDVNFTKPAQVP